MVGGKNKYLINGKNVLNKKVHDLFCSVQLNVNNPNFLIMQGRVTKVLNMKPAEILSMIEEASGTGMYEGKRDITIKALGKKEAKLKELETLLSEELTPQLEKLRKERAIYIEYQHVCSDVEYLTRIFYSHKYLLYKRALQSCTDNINKIENGITADEQTIVNSQARILEIDAEVIQMQKVIDEESGGELKKLETELEQLSVSDGKTLAEFGSTKDAINSAKRNLKLAEKSLRDDEIALRAKENEMASAGDTFQKLKADDEADRLAFERAEKKFEAVSSGLSTNEDGELASLEDQLMSARTKASEAGTTIKKCEMETRQVTQMLKDKQNESQTSDSNYTRQKTQAKQMEANIERMTAELGGIKYTAGSLQAVQERKFASETQVRDLQRQLGRMGTHRFDFQYSDPIPNFDRRRVFGRLCKLFGVKDSKNYLALQIVGGGALYQVACDTEETGQLIIERGNLAQRSTMIPLNKIQGRSIDPAAVQLAEKLVGRENVYTAISAITYEDRLDPIMRYAFGSTLICRDMDVATKVCYHPKIYTRCVTLGGDICDPGGSLEGGAAPAGNPILSEIAEIRELERLLADRQSELKQATTEYGQLEAVATRFDSLTENIDLTRLEYDRLLQSLALHSVEQHKRECEEHTQNLEALQQRVKEARAVQVKENAKIKDIESKLKDSKGHRERELKAAEAEMKAIKKKSEASAKCWKRREQEFQTMSMEIEELKKAVLATNEQLANLKISIIDLEAKYMELEAKCADSRSVVDVVKVKIKDQKKKIHEQNRELAGQGTAKDKLAKDIQNLTLGIKKKQNEVKNIRTENKDALGKVSMLEKKYEWINDDKDLFGLPNSRYDYSKDDPEQAGKKLGTLTEQKEKLGRNINHKAMELLEQQEKRFTDVSVKIKRVQNDRDSILTVIQNFDEKKKLEVKKAWAEVNDNFGGIFSTLLPGTNAKLQQPEGMEYYEGLEVKVSFNGMWKENLTELSGGQRSLVALSLILAMLKFKPAPLYILDEVDAALDLSHTQNIGNMLKAHFKNSQFVVVSLKDGMFNNANVLFQTSFVDGMSHVQRTNNANKK